MENYQLINRDCLEEMKNISDKSIDMILCDLQKMCEKPTPLGVGWIAQIKYINRF